MAKNKNGSNNNAETTGEVDSKNVKVDSQKPMNTSGKNMKYK
ncbi:MAG: hypothetical protein JWM44_2743 [Bacilli bacterium]|nr:hypothetical protein [Bacilli bacterium]